MIRLILNGYYRAGTTILYRIMRDSNPDLLHLYEPLTPDIAEKIFWKGDLRLHGFNAYKCYLNKRIDFGRFIALHKKTVRGKDFIPTSLEEVRELFDFFHNLPVDTTVQPNRCHLILEFLSKRYNCPFIHIIRNPVDTWISQVYTPLLKEKIGRYEWAKRLSPVYRFILTKYLPSRKWCNGFYIEEDYSIIKKFGVPEAENHLDKMLVIWTVFNYTAYKQAKISDGMIVYYEEFARNPEKWLEKMSKFSGVNFDLKFAEIVKPKITRDEKLREYFIKRLEMLELLEVVNGFYPPERWYGGD